MPNGKRILRVAIATLLISFAAVGCRPPMSPTVTDPVPGADLFKSETEKKINFADAKQLEMISQKVNAEYVMGAGDVLSLDVWNRPEVSTPELLIGPDGYATIPRLGALMLKGLTREEGSELIKQKLSALYTSVDATLTIRAYRNNKAYVLGHVRSPGIVQFQGQGSLIEAISLAGGIYNDQTTIRSTEATQCALIRGNSQIFWIDLDDLLLNGNMALNATIQPNDVVFVPEAKQALIYVMGEVFRPGALVLSRDMTLWDAMMLSGGPTDDAMLEKTFLIRWDGEKSYVREINLKEAIRSGNLSQNYVLKDNDIIYLAQKGIANWNYVINQITPTMRVISLTRDSLDNMNILNR